MRPFSRTASCLSCLGLVFLSTGIGCSVDKMGLPAPAPVPVVSKGTGGSMGATGGDNGFTGATGSGGGPVGSGGTGVVGSGGHDAEGTPGSGGVTSATGGTGGDEEPGTGGSGAGTGGMTMGAAGVVGGPGGTDGAGGSGGGGTGGSPVIIGSTIGCADGTREAFANVVRFPAIAGCAGGWTVPGVLTLQSLTPACARAAGNSGARPNGTGCTVEDLCAIGWHVCMDARELTTLGVTCQDAAIPMRNNSIPQFFATRQRGVQATACASNDINPNHVNNVHGCGNFGLPEDQNCASLDRQLSHTECDDNPPWSCDDPNSATDEAQVVVKPGPGAGGVLCCRQGG